MLLVYNCVLLKMSTWCSKHVEENSILWINNNQCIKLVINVNRNVRGLSDDDAMRFSCKKFITDHDRSSHIVSTCRAYMPRNTGAHEPIPKRYFYCTNWTPPSIRVNPSIFTTTLTNKKYLNEQFYCKIKTVYDIFIKKWPCIHEYVRRGPVGKFCLITYLLHGAESFLRS